MRNELIPFLPANGLIQEVQKVEALLIWNTGESIVRVFTLEVLHELCELVVLAITVHAVLESLPSND
jgi:hypothetical protein